MQQTGLETLVHALLGTGLHSHIIPPPKKKKPVMGVGVDKIVMLGGGL